MSARMPKKLPTIIALVVVAVTPMAVWLISVRNPASYLAHELPPGQSAFVISKLAALLAFFALWMQCMLGMAQRTPLLQGRLVISNRTHRRLGLLTLLLVATHVALFVTAASLRTGAPAWSLLLPAFTNGYYNTLVAVGAVALWLLLVGVFAGRQVHRGKRKWRTVHAVWPMVFALVFTHAFSIGSESRFGLMRYLLPLMAASLAATAFSRWRSTSKRRL